jgi:hypothetical protein
MLVIIILLIIIITYLVHNCLKRKRHNRKTIIVYDDNEVVHGMLGSYPSDNIETYDSRTTITMNISNIDHLLTSFQKNADKVLHDFTRNRNSIYFKAYLYDFYRCTFLFNDNILSDDQKTTYNNIINNTASNITAVFTHYINIIKHYQYSDYSTLSSELIDTNTNTLRFDYNALDQVFDYILQNSNIPANVVDILYYKLDNNGTEILNNIIELANDDPYVTLTSVMQVVDTDVPPEFTLLNTPNDTGYWTNVYNTLHSNYINGLLIHMIKLSFMNEDFYKNVLITIMATIKDSKITNAIDSIFNICRMSDFNIIKTFSFQFTEKIIEEAIKDDIVIINSTSSEPITNTTTTNTWPY